MYVERLSLTFVLMIKLINTSVKWLCSWHTVLLFLCFLFRDVYKLAPELIEGKQRLILFLSLLEVIVVE